MASRKVFEVSVETGLEPIEFAVRFHFTDERPAEEEVFHAHPRKTAGADITYGSIIRITPDGRTIMDTAGIRMFVDKVLVEADKTRFGRLLDDPFRVVDGAQLGEIVNWLIEEYGGRPTGPSSS